MMFGKICQMSVVAELHWNIGLLMWILPGTDNLELNQYVCHIYKNETNLLTIFIRKTW